MGLYECRTFIGSCSFRHNQKSECLTLAFALLARLDGFNGKDIVGVSLAGVVEAVWDMGQQMDGTYTENFAVNWLETNYIANFAENDIEELTARDVTDRPQALFGKLKL